MQPTRKQTFETTEAPPTQNEETNLPKKIQREAPQAASNHSRQQPMIELPYMQQHAITNMSQHVLATPKSQQSQAPAHYLLTESARASLSWSSLNIYAPHHPVALPYYLPFIAPPQLQQGAIHVANGAFCCQRYCMWYQNYNRKGRPPHDYHCRQQAKFHRDILETRR